MAVARRMTWQWLAEAVVGGKGGGGVDGGVDAGVSVCWRRVLVKAVESVAGPRHRVGGVCGGCGGCSGSGSGDCTVLAVKVVERDMKAAKWT